MFKFSIYFAISFAILCIPFGNDQRFFDTLYRAATPYTNEAVSTIKQKVATTTRYSKKLFSNTLPSEDQISTSRSAVQKNEYLENGNDAGIDLEENIDENEISAEERNEVLKAMK
jgi:hypothetical protein